jgi:high-affinity nickel-transport protein
MNIAAILALGFFLGMRHATDPDHVVAVSTIVSRARSLRAAAPIGLFWGIGHTVTVVLIGGAIAVFGLVIPPRAGLAMEGMVAVMLVILGAAAILGVVRSDRVHPHRHEAVGETEHRLRPQLRRGSMRPFVVGLVHGMAGSAAVALLVAGTIRNPWWAILYLVVFGAGTLAGMLVVTTAIAVPVTAAASRFERLRGLLGAGTGMASIAFGMVLIYEVGFVHGLFAGHVDWTPR